MSLLTAFGITSVQKASKKNEKKRKAIMVIKLVTSVRVLLKTFLFSLLLSCYHIPRFGIWVNFPPFRDLRLRSSLLPLLASPVYRMSRIVLLIKSTLLNVKGAYVIVIVSVQ